MLTDHPLRFIATNELHARPFPVVEAPGFAAFLAVSSADNGPEDDHAILVRLLERFGAAPPPPEATHWFGKIGRHALKWERHTEFTSFTVFGKGVAERPFDPSVFEVFPADWLAALPGNRLTSALIRVERLADEAEIPKRLSGWLVRENQAVSRVLDDAAVIATDFRIDSAGHVRFAVFARPDVGARRIGRVVQRLCEIETYKTLAMFGLIEARALAPDVAAAETRLNDLVQKMGGRGADAEETLNALLEVSSDLEALHARSQFRFAATRAYATLVNERVKILREGRIFGRQTFGEFMERRFQPSMRTVEATAKRLNDTARSAGRASELLRTQVDVERSAQNQKLLASMDRRAQLQLRLQETVEGLSVVAISYYAVNLIGYFLYPAFEPLGLSKAKAMAGLTPLVVLLVWLVGRRIRKRLH